VAQGFYKIISLEFYHQTIYRETSFNRERDKLEQMQALDMMLLGF